MDGGPIAGRAFEIGRFQRLDQMIAHFDGVAQRLHGEGNFFETRQPEEIGGAAERDHQLIVREVVDMGFLRVSHAHGLAGEIHRLHFSVKKIDVPQHFADGIHDVCEIDVAGRDLVQHWREENEVLPAHQRHLKIAAASGSFIQFEGRIQTAKSAAQYQNSLFHGVFRTALFRIA